MANYNLEASLSKSVNECSSVKGENELLRKQLAEQVSSATASAGSGGGGQSIKNKLNPFALAKNIAHKVDARRANSGAADKQNSAAIASTTTVQFSLGSEEAHHLSGSSSSNTDLSRRLEAQEAEFLKTNETLKQEIVLLQKELKAAQDAANLHQQQQFEQQPVTTSDTNLAATDKIAEPLHPPQLSTTSSHLSLSSQPLTTSAYSPSRQLQQSLAQLTASLSTRQQKLKWVDATGPLVDRFIDSLSLVDDVDTEATEQNLEQKAAIEALLQAVITTTNSNNFNHQSSEGSITDENITTTDGTLSENNHNDLLDNTTEDFKQLVAFCGRLQQAQQAEAQALLGQLAREVVKHNRRQREVFSEALAEEAGRTTQLKAELDRLQTEKLGIEATLAQMKAQIETLKTEKANLERLLAEQSSLAATETTKQQKTSEEALASAQQTIDRLQAEVAEAANANKISEKRGLKIIKELTKQLAGEKKRAEKLQAMIISSGGDVPSSSTSTASNNNTLHSSVSKTDTASCSSGSWSYMAESQNSKSNAHAYHHQQEPGSNDLETVQSPPRQSVSEKVPNAVITDQPFTTTTTSSTTSLHPNSHRAAVSGKSRGTSVTSVASSGTLEAENVSLLSRISTLQQDNWRLEEQVDQLQHELANKSRLIEFYCIRSDGRSAGNGGGGGTTSPISSSSVVDHGTSNRQSFNRDLSRQNSGSSSVSSSQTGMSNSTQNPVLRMVSFLKEKGEQVTSSGSGGSGFGDSSPKSTAMMDVNRKLQHMVEEILTKNMHLQANLEELSNQLMEAKGRLKKYEPESPIATSKN